MYATLGHALPRSGGWTYEPKYDAVRDDKAARDVTVEGVSMERWGTGEIANDAA